jgi:hypothetical protein
MKPKPEKTKNKLGTQKKRKNQELGICTRKAQCLLCVTAAALAGDKESDTSIACLCIMKKSPQKKQQQQALSLSLSLSESLPQNPIHRRNSNGVARTAKFPRALAILVCNSSQIL